MKAQIGESSTDNTSCKINATKLKKQRKRTRAGNYFTIYANYIKIRSFIQMYTFVPCHPDST